MQGLYGMQLRLVVWTQTNLQKVYRHIKRKHSLCIMDFPNRTSLTFFLCVFLFPWFSKAELVKHYQRQFKLKFFGSLANEEEVLFSGEGKSFITAVNQCSEFCRRDRRCIGMELCKITENRTRCRVCCKTKMEEEGIPSNNTDRCRYMTMVRYDFLLIKLLNKHCNTTLVKFTHLYFQLHVQRMKNQKGTVCTYYVLFIVWNLLQFML